MANRWKMPSSPSSVRATTRCSVASPGRVTGRHGSLMRPGACQLQPNCCPIQITAWKFGAMVTNLMCSTSPRPPRAAHSISGGIDARLLFGGNAIPDLWEQFYGLPVDVDVHADPDADRMTHREEFIAGTSPVDGSSRLVLFEEEAAPDGTVTVRWLAQPDRRYRVLQSDSLFESMWTPVYEPPASPTAVIMEYTQPAGDTPDYLRVDVQFP